MSENQNPQRSVDPYSSQQPSAQPGPLPDDPNQGSYSPPASGHNPPQGVDSQPPGGYSQPQAGYSQQGGYGAPGPQQSYGYQPQPGQPAYGSPQMALEQLGGNLTLNYWLSAFFFWVPALIFFVIDRGKAPLVDQHLKAILNFQISRTIYIVGAYVLMFFAAFTESLGFVTFVTFLIGIVALAFFVIGIIGAATGPGRFRQGQPYNFPLTINLIK